MNRCDDKRLKLANIGPPERLSPMSGVQAHRVTQGMLPSASGTRRFHRFSDAGACPVVEGDTLRTVGELVARSGGARLAGSRLCQRAPSFGQALRQNSEADASTSFKRRSSPRLPHIEIGRVELGQPCQARPVKDADLIPAPLNQFGIAQIAHAAIDMDCRIA